MTYVLLCHNYVFLSCGHSYHPWCLLEHSKVSSKCLVKDCEVESINDWRVAMGYRLNVTSSPTITMAPLEDYVPKRNHKMNQQPNSTPTMNGKS
jgi:hypothetical protein